MKFHVLHVAFAGGRGLMWHLPSNNLNRTDHITFVDDISAYLFVSYNISESKQIAKTCVPLLDFVKYMSWPNFFDFYSSFDSSD